MKLDDRLKPADAGAPRKLSSAERAYRELKARVINNEMPPGATYFEPELAEMLGVNRTVAHEAAALLEREGLVEVRPRRGMRVRPLAADDMHEIYGILTELEALAAELCAQRGLSESEIDDLRTTITEMESALEADELSRWAEADERFHLMLAAFSGSQRLMAAINIHWDQAHRARLLTLPLRPKPTGSNRDHAELVDALEARNPERARAIHRAHRIKARDALVAIIAKHNLSRF